ncbi:hypothetical protein L1887_01406 [Cichorium endivia]|nr:hypothetical protein L1887_01406 [Cichorium endivia]
MAINKTSPWRVDFLLFLCVSIIILSSTKGNGQPLAPGIMVFGDSIVTVGNNNHLKTIVQSNFPPYGRDFINQNPTGRFCNGKLALDFTCENLGLTNYPPGILSKEAKGENLLNGANFASGGSGYYKTTARLYNTIPLNKQLRYYKKYQKKLVGVAGTSNATSIITGSVYLISAGTSDFVQNYYVNPFLYKVYTPYEFSDILIQAYSRFIQKLYRLGARKIGVSTVPPIGCLPASITIFGKGCNECVIKMNSAAEYFNRKLNATSIILKAKLSGLNLVVLDIYKPLYNLIRKPTDFGFFETRKACCGTGLVEASFLCNERSPGTCANATGYVFWDGFHLTEAANKILADELLIDGLSLVS